MGKRKTNGKGRDKRGTEKSRMNKKKTEVQIRH